MMILGWKKINLKYTATEFSDIDRGYVVIDFSKEEKKTNVTTTLSTPDSRNEGIVSKNKHAINTLYHSTVS